MSESPVIKHWTIYKITNPIGQIYVGRTSNLKARLRNYESLSSYVLKQPRIAESLINHGFDVHAVEILEQFESDIEWADDKEMFWIRTNMSNYSKWPDQKGLNLTNGGQGTNGATLSKETKERQSKAQKGKKLSQEHIDFMKIYFKENPTMGMLGKNHTEATKTLMSELKKGKAPLHLVGKPLSEAHKAKLSNLMKGKPSPNKGKNIWSATDKERIGQSKKGNTYFKGKTHSQEARNKLSLSHIGKGTKPIIQYNHDGVIMKEFDSIKKAAQELKLNENTIIRILKGYNKNPHKLIFKYK